MNDFTKGLIGAAVPIGLLSLLSTGGAGGPAASGLYYLWFLAGVLWIIAVLVGVGFSVGGRGQAAAGVFTGVAIGFLALFTTCLANLNTVRFTS